MKLTNADILIGDRFVRGGVAFSDVIEAAGPEISDGADLGGAYVIPGLVDIHTHGAAGADASDGDAEGLLRLSRSYAAKGVTSWCPTTMTLDEPALTRAMEAIRAFSRPEDGAKLLGAHLEGPFLSFGKRGAQNPDFLALPDAALFERLRTASGNRIRLITLAPELPGAIPFIEAHHEAVTISLGHTEADEQTAAAAYRAGASHTTHLFNGMNGLGHRAPGVIGAAFDGGATVELIADGLHVHPSVVRMTHRLFGDRLALVSDSLRCTGLPDGEYLLGGQSVTLQGGRATLTGTDTLAGSAVSLTECMRRAVRFGIPLPDAVCAASLVPARVVRMADAIGSIEPGKRADLVVLDRNLCVRQVYIEGKRVK